MPGYTYGISAQLCNVGAKLREVPGSVCSGCYARTSFYETWRPLLRGHAIRERGLRHPLWVDAMVKLITNYCVGEDAVFRWHDSGDLRGLWHLENIVSVCELTPHIRHWLPTREYDVVIAFLALGREFPENLCVRLSAHMIDSEPVLPAELAGFPTSTVSSVPRRITGVQIVEGKGSVECRAIETRDNKCGPCRACWSRDVTNVCYEQH